MDRVADSWLLAATTPPAAASANPALGLGPAADTAPPAIADADRRGRTAGDPDPGRLGGAAREPPAEPPDAQRKSRHPAGVLAPSATRTCSRCRLRAEAGGEAPRP